MYRTTTMLAALVFAASACALAQQSNSQAPEDAFTTRQLIAWSGLQKPQPTPEPLPPRDTPVPQPDQPSNQQANPPADPQSERKPTESFTGKIARDGYRYCLQSGSKTYLLSEQDGLQKYENQPVRVVGSFDSSTDTIRVLKIDVIS